MGQQVCFEAPIGVLSVQRLRTLKEEGCGFVVEAGSAQCQNKRKHMEDYVLTRDRSYTTQKTDEKCDEKCEKRQQAYLFAVFDGHSGSQTSEYLASNMEHYLPVGWEHWPTKWEDSKRKETINGCLRLDDEICKRFGPATTRMPDCKRAQLKHPTNNWPGSTAIVALLSETVSKDSLFLLTLLQVGDSRAILVSSSGKILYATRDHNFRDPHEVTRVTQSKGVIRDGRLEGNLAVTRAFGDAGELKLKGLIAEPSLVHLPIHAGDTLLLFSDGLFEQSGLHDHFDAETNWLVQLLKLCWNPMYDQYDVGYCCSAILRDLCNGPTFDNLSLCAVRFRSTIHSRFAPPRFELIPCPPPLLTFTDMEFAFAFWESVYTFTAQHIKNAQREGQTLEKRVWLWSLWDQKVKHYSSLPCVRSDEPLDKKQQAKTLLDTKVLVPKESQTGDIEKKQQLAAPSSSSTSSTPQMGCGHIPISTNRELFGVHTLQDISIISDSFLPWDCLFW